MCQNINAIIKSAHARTNKTPSVDDWINELSALCRELLVSCRFVIVIVIALATMNEKWDVKSDLCRIEKANASNDFWVYTLGTLHLSVWNNDLMCSHHLYAFIRLDKFVYVASSHRRLKFLCFSFLCWCVIFLHLLFIRSSAMCVPQMAAAVAVTFYA